jgi:hypothetical protein
MFYNGATWDEYWQGKEHRQYDATTRVDIGHVWFSETVLNARMHRVSGAAAVFQ